MTALCAGAAAVSLEPPLGLPMVGFVRRHEPARTSAGDLEATALALESDREERAVLAAAASMIHSMSGRTERCRELFLGAEADSRHLDASQAAQGQARRQVLPFAYLALGHPATGHRNGRTRRDFGSESDDG